MSGPRSVRAARLVVLLLVASSAAVGGPVRPAGAGVSVASDGTRVTVSGYRAGGEDHVQLTRSGSSGRPMTCRELISETNGIIDVDGVLAGRSWPPLERDRTARWRYWLDCRYLDGTAVELGDSGLGYVYADEIVDIDAVVRTLARRYLSETVAPALSIGTSPPVGLVAVPQWFWAAGADAAEGEQVHDVLGHRVVLRLELGEVAWSFGDGTGAHFGREGLGVAGGPGAVSHRYRTRSTSAEAPQGAFPVGVTVGIGLRYTLDGGPWLTVEPPLQVTGTADLVVREAQAVVHG